MNVYEIVTDKIIKQLEQGAIPWKKQWTAGLPINYSSKKPYHGMNRILLGMTDYKLPYYVTYKQAQEMGGSVKKGEHGHLVIFWKMLEHVKKLEGGDESDSNTGNLLVKRDAVPMLRYYTVFNIEQCDGLPVPEELKKTITPIDACTQIIAGYEGRPTIEHGGSRAYYRPSTDSVKLPDRNVFDSASAYYSTMFHELTHSTGHSKRLNRFTNESEDQHIFGSESYSNEELVAELGSAFLCNDTGIGQSELTNQAAYIQSWLKALKNDTRLIVVAASKAQKAVNWIKNERPEKKN